MDSIRYLILFMARCIYLPAIALFFLCCQSPDKPLNKFSDAVILKIADFQDRRLADSLYPFFGHSNPLYRRDAIHAFGSLQDAGQVDKIGKLLLMDPEPPVRKAAAFALGQLEHPACERILLGALVKEKNAAITHEILEAYGKTTRRWQLDPSMFADDTVRTAGLAWSVYRAGIRGRTDSLANAVAARLLDKGHSENTRLGAAHYFSRGARDFQAAEAALIATALRDPSAEVRMAAALALGKIPSDSCLASLKEIIKNDADTRVVVNALRALKPYPYNQVKHYLYEAVRHSDINVGIAASEVIVETVPAADWIEVSNLTNQATDWRIQANLYEAALKAGNNSDLAREIQGRYQNTSGPYQRAALLGSLRFFPDAYAFVQTELRAADNPIVRSAAAATLVAMNKVEGFPPPLTPRFAALYRDILSTQEDPAVIGSIASALADSALGYRNHIRDVSFLYSAKERLRLPQDNESLQSVEAAIAWLEKRPAVPVKNEFNHPIDWELVKRIPAGQLATIRTSRGSIIIRLLVNESPGSVANFITLAQKGYFRNLSIHRVVPNFVIQDGCNRGDGWGGEDYSIRSEFSPRGYRTGSVGMASAGKDTEGTQWFITHSPTPHLDGRYTVFGEVMEGQTVVDYLRVGDKITDVDVDNFPDE